MASIHPIDLDYLGEPETIAAYLVAGAGPDDLILIETGPANTIDALLKGIETAGFDPARIRHVAVTHIHLDHAGAAGWWTRQGATVYVHEFGAKHLIDPSKLIASAERIYGDQMTALWGTVVSAREDCVVPLRHRDTVVAGGLRLTAIETPGHARHHHAFRLASSGGSVCFTGDAAGMIVPGPRFITLPTPPPEFDLVEWLTSITRLEQERFERLYLTHFGAVEDVRGHLERLRTALRDHATFVVERIELPRQTLIEEYQGWVRADALAAGVSRAQITRHISGNLIAMSADGMRRYWLKSREARRAPEFA